MPYLEIKNSAIYYEEAGSGPETIVFSHGLLMSSKMFRDQIQALRDFLHQNL